MERGLAYQLGCWLFEEFFDRNYIEGLRDEYRVWYLENLLDFLSLHGVSPSATTIIEAGKLLARVWALFGDGTYENECKYYAFLESEEGAEEILTAFDRIEARYRSIRIPLIT